MQSFVPIADNIIVTGILSWRSKDVDTLKTLLNIVS
jgi:hypothetical protein